MTRAVFWVLVAAMAWGCEKDDATSSGGMAGTSNTAGSSGTAGSGAGPGQGAGGKPKAAAIACGSLGQSCFNNDECAGVSCLYYTGLFDDNPGICVPSQTGLSCGSDAACDADKPICIRYSTGTAGTCVTEPELDCVCAGELGATAVPRCTEPGASERVCIQPGGSCDLVPCCTGALCTTGADGTPYCEQTCDSADDCDTACCVADRCAPNVDCCSRDDGPCGVGSTSQCCSGYTCSTFSEVTACHKDCTRDADCAPGCCAPLDTGKMVCLGEDLCGGTIPNPNCATEVDAPCEGIGCCGELGCASPNTGETFTCRPQCSAAEPCASGCCVEIPGAGFSVCFDPPWCN
jgi:hypothetical protein